MAAANATLELVEPWRKAQLLCKPYGGNDREDAKRFAAQFPSQLDSIMLDKGTYTGGDVLDGSHDGGANAGPLTGNAAAIRTKRMNMLARERRILSEFVKHILSESTAAKYHLIDEIRERSHVRGREDVYRLVRAPRSQRRRVTGRCATGCWDIEIHERSRGLLNKALGQVAERALRVHALFHEIHLRARAQGWARRVRCACKGSAGGGARAVPARSSTGLGSSRAMGVHATPRLGNTFSHRSALGAPRLPGAALCTSPAAARARPGWHSLPGPASRSCTRPAISRLVADTKALAGPSYLSLPL